MKYYTTTFQIMSWEVKIIYKMEIGERKKKEMSKSRHCLERLEDSIIIYDSATV